MSFLNVAIGVSALTSAASAIFQGKAAETQAEYDAKSQELEAENEMAEAREAAKRKRAENQAILARQLAIRAGQGVDVSTGSSLLIQAESAARLEMEVQEEARVSSNRVRALQSGAAASRHQGRLARKTSYFQAGAHLIGGAVDIGQNMQFESALRAANSKVTIGPMTAPPTIGPMQAAPVRNPPQFNANVSPIANPTLPSGRRLTFKAFA